MASYRLYGGELSLFTRKLEAALVFYGADFDFLPKEPANAAELETRSGTHQVPVLRTPENWMLADTTPIMELLDARFPGRELFPAGDLGVLTHVIEEFFDEWVARVMVHYRWHYPESAEFAAQRIGRGHPERAAQILQWGPRACRATGTESPSQQQAAEAEYRRVLVAAEAQLQQTRFLLGDRPTAVDCIVLGGLRAHTYTDPVPKRVVANYPAVVAWAERGANDWDGSGELAPFPASTPFARFALAELPLGYAPFVLANAAALAAGSKTCRAEVFGEEVSFLTRPYPERSRQMIRDRIARVGPSPAIATWLDDIGLTEVFQ
ncbi:MAG: glutathione S-transferase family protein [Pseudomonadota bacterium]